MERNRKTPPLFLLLLLLQVCTTRTSECPSLPDKNLTCYNDFSQNITCVWNSTYVFDGPDAECSIHATKVRISPFGRLYSASCNLKPVDISRPDLQKCLLTFHKKKIFFSHHELSINLSCNPVKQGVIISYKPVCHVKLNPPGKPDINFTSVSWFSQVPKHDQISHYSSELQWKQQNQLWDDPSMQKQQTLVTECTLECETKLEEDSLIQGETYEARVRVRVQEDGFKGTWSDWSPTASWESPVGRTKAPSGIAVGVLHMILAGVAVSALLLTVVFLRADKTTWVYMVKKIKGPPIPNPANSFLRNGHLQSWWRPHFTSESFHSFLKPVDIVSAEVTSSVDVITPFRPDAKMFRNNGSHQSKNSCFSNPSYSELCTDPVSSLTAGNLEPCVIDAPYGPVGCQDAGQNTEQVCDVMRGKEMEILQLLSKGGSNSEAMQVISDYEKCRKFQVERFRLLSLDSGMCTCEEVSQESMEADSINVTDSHDEGPEDEEEREGGFGGKVHFQMLFGSSGGTSESIQLCSDYEQVPKLQADSPELPSLDSGVSSGGEEQVSQEESRAGGDWSTECTRFPFPPCPSSALQCSLLSSQQMPLNLLPLPNHILERVSLMSTGRSVEPSGDGYMPVRQEQS
ncbi:uncharacterized protein [Embiotoca jacksoni]|uniref:uncharacterized protein n=1 Tax=Embiotoca jacksoni TaxID=100190 RepID=UPI0037045660